MSVVRATKSLSIRVDAYRIVCATDRIQIRKFNTTEFSEIPSCRHVPSEYKGASYNDVWAAHKTIASPSLKPFYKKPLLIHEGRGQWLWDHTGRRYLDMFGGIATISVGHCHPKIAAIVHEQASKLTHISSIYMHPRLQEYAKKLTSTLPEKLNVVYLTNSGTEANELAFLMAKVYTGNNSILSLRNAYHGGSYATSASTAMFNWKYPVAQPPGHIHVVHPDVYRGPWGGANCRDSPVQVKGRQCDCTNGQCKASDKYIDDFDNTFRYSLSKNNIAAFIAESIQGVGGTVQYPKNFIGRVFDRVRKNGGLCIADEVQTGFGRTGEHFWGFEGHDVIPDIVTAAKGIGNGFPLGAVVTTEEIANSLNRSLHFNTFGGNPIACAVGLAVLNIIEEEGLQNNAHVVGTYLLNQLSTLLSEFPEIIGDVRGKGLMIGVELISDSKSKEYPVPEHMDDIFEDIKNMGVLLGKGGIHSNVLRIKPPMCVTKEDADFTVEVIRKAIQRHQSKYLRKIACAIS